MPRTAARTLAISIAAALLGLVASPSAYADAGAVPPPDETSVTVRRGCEVVLVWPQVKGDPLGVIGPFSVRTGGVRVPPAGQCL